MTNALDHVKAMGKRAESARLKKGMSINELARRTNLSTSTIHNLENPKAKKRPEGPTMDTLHKVCEVLNVSMYWVMTGEELE